MIFKHGEEVAFMGYIHPDNERLCGDLPKQRMFCLYTKGNVPLPSNWRFMIVDDCEGWNWHPVGNAFDALVLLSALWKVDKHEIQKPYPRDGLPTTNDRYLFYQYYRNCILMMPDQKHDMYIVRWYAGMPMRLPYRQEFVWNSDKYGLIREVMEQLSAEGTINTPSYAPGHGVYSFTVTQKIMTRIFEAETDTSRRYFPIFRVKKCLGIARMPNPLQILRCYEFLEQVQQNFMISRLDALFHEGSCLEQVGSDIARIPDSLLGDFIFRRQHLIADQYVIFKQGVDKQGWNQWYARRIVTRPWCLPWWFARDLPPSALGEVQDLNWAYRK